MDNEKLNELAAQGGLEEKLSFVDQYALIEREYYIVRVDNEQYPFFFTFSCKYDRDPEGNMLRFEYETAKRVFFNTRDFYNKQAMINYLMTHAPLFFRNYYAKNPNNEVDRETADAMTRVIKETVRGNDYDLVKSLNELYQMALNDVSLV